jgi:hypothetical protein
MSDDFFDDDESEDSIEIKLIMPAALISEFTTVCKVGGEQTFELRNKLPSYSKVKGISISVKNESNEPVKFLISRTIDIVSYDTPLRIDYESWVDGIYSILEQFEDIQEQLESIQESGDEEKLKKFSEYKISLIVPLGYIDNGKSVCLEKGTRIYTVYKGTPNKKRPYELNKIKAEINIDNTGIKKFEIPADSIFLVSNTNVHIKKYEDFVKIEKTVADIEELISVAQNFIDHRESK